MIKVIILLTSLLFPSSDLIKIKPEFSYVYSSDNEQFPIEIEEIQGYQFSLRAIYSREKLRINAVTGYYFIDGMNDGYPSDFTREQGLHHVENPPGLADDQRNYYISNMIVEYGDSSHSFFINKSNKHWGPGINSLLISNKIPSFFHFGFKFKVHKKINFEYFHGKLKSNINDENYNFYYKDAMGTRGININRNIVGHRIEWNIMNKIILSGSELIVYANRSIEMMYLLPFVSFFPVQTQVGEIDNVILSADITYLINNNFRLYGAFIMDEWSPPYTFDKDNRNWFGWQSGFSVKNTLIKSSILNVEYTWTDHRIYRHRFEVNDYYSWGYPVGFWAGPHAHELYIDYNFEYSNVKYKFIFSDASRGELTDFMIEDQYSRPNETKIYKRFSEFKERKQLYSISMAKQLSDNLNIEFSYTYVDWTNAGFNPKYPDSNLPNIIKKSIGFSLQYFFKD